jgi:hypothetical protein
MKMLLQKLHEAGLGQTEKEAIVDLCLLGNDARSKRDFGFLW